jgi:hypothetical protein
VQLVGVLLDHLFEHPGVFTRRFCIVNGTRANNHQEAAVVTP